MTEKALIVRGGWEGHVPEQMAAWFNELLTGEGYETRVTADYEIFADAEGLQTFDLIVPCITMDQCDDAWVDNVVEAVAAGTGIAGCHGGMGDTFRANSNWQFMVGGQFVAHPGDIIDYPVHFKNSSSEIVRGLEDFSVKSEQYYMHVDPSVEVLAVTPFPTAEGHHTVNGAFEMPVAWTRRWGRGRVFYCSIGHEPADLSGTPGELIRRGLLWAAR